MAIAVNHRQTFDLCLVPLSTHVLSKASYYDTLFLILALYLIPISPCSVPRILSGLQLAREGIVLALLLHLHWHYSHIDFSLSKLSGFRLYGLLFRLAALGSVGGWWLHRGDV